MSFDPAACLIFDDRTGSLIGVDAVKVRDWFTKQYSVLSIVPTGDIYVYNNGVFRCEGGSKEWITHKLYENWGRYTLYDGSPLLSINRVRELVAFIQLATYQEMFLDVSTRKTVFDANLDIVNMANGLYNWRTNEFMPHTREYLSRIQIPVRYVEGATCPTIDAIIGDVLKPQDVPKFYEFAGYLFYRGVAIDKAVMMLYGPARSGKSELARLIMNAVGINNCAAVTPQELGKDKFATAALEGKLVNLVGDVDDKPIENEGVFKKVTSGKDLLQIEKKFQQPVQVINTCKMVLIANMLPPISDLTKGFFRRMEIFGCYHVFDPLVDDPERLKAIDNPMELSGFVIKCLGMLPGVLSRKMLTNEMSADDVRSLYIMNANPVQGFIDLCIDDDVPGGFASKDMTYKYYVDFCRTIKVEKLSKTMFGKAFKKAMGWTGNERQSQRKFHGGDKWGWTEIRLKKPELMLEKLVC